MQTHQQHLKVEERVAALAVEVLGTVREEGGLERNTQRLSDERAQGREVTSEPGVVRGSERRRGGTGLRGQGQRFRLESAGKCEKAKILTATTAKDAGNEPGHALSHMKSCVVPNTRGMLFVGCITT